MINQQIVRNRQRIVARYCLILSVLLSLVLANSAVASSINVSPVRIFFKEGKAVTSIKVTNQSETAVMVQTKLVSWQQQGDQEILEPSDDLIVSPPIFELPPNGTQTVRFAQRAPTINKVEKTYRVFISELPIVDESRTSGSVGAKIAVNLRLSLPIFIPPSEDRKDFKFSLRPSCEDDGMVFIAKNIGTLHDRIASFKIRDEESDSVLYETADARYILPGATITWSVPIKKDISKQSLKAYVDYFPIRYGDAPITVDAANCDAPSQAPS